MFKRLELETWHDFVPLIAFFITFAVFLVALVKAFRLRADQADIMANLPLDNEPATPQTHDHE